MPLSEYEQRVLEQMERQLRSDDPKLASTLHGRTGSPVRRWVLGAVGGLAGLGLLIGGVASGMWWLGLLGFVAMFGAVLLVFSAPRRAAAGQAAGTTSSPAKKKTSLLNRFEERWERRREQR
ncbi:DUF3040 domain-containing protein [Actinotalea sp. M2MS4P-6]|uniref:DUF3040 domain-containing protein n=1 Tax=Actinotalea sp. M2MS4P-6 TaxID=2983762 RepID=UPI0021E4DE3B|nr:DUF3040 domain-containing protein [Actinotalea sp. M2MS4P-6]MCV2393432.1 DUF3040 domain-containing protein [Actinotalea sp. M2MS4P-6]